MQQKDERIRDLEHSQEPLNSQITNLKDIIKQLEKQVEQQEQAKEKLEQELLGQKREI